MSAEADLRGCIPVAGLAIASQRDDGDIATTGGGTIFGGAALLLL